MTRIPLEFYPGMNRFVLDWLRGDERFLRRSAAKNNAGRTAGAPLVAALSQSNRAWGNDVDAELQRWASGKTRVVVAGQQVGFAGGPLYTFVKLASLLKMKQEDENTTAFFWLATEDHDFEEVANIALPRRDADGQTDLVHLRYKRHSESRRIVGPQVVPECLIEDLLRTLNIDRPSWLRPGITFRDSFAELIATVAGGKVILLDSLLPELRRAGEPLMASIIARWQDIQREIESRSKALEKAGYKPQVEPRPGESYTLLFRIDADGNRELLNHPKKDESPETLSTSALTRPLLQDFVLQPDVFIGGPAEVAYFAQIATVHDMLNVPMPKIALRGHVLVAPRRVMRTLDKYSIDPREVFARPEDVLASREPAAVDAIKRAAADGQRELDERIATIRQLALPADHAVARSVERSIGHINYHFRKLTGRAIRAVTRKDRERFDAVREVVSTFFPDRHVQDRVVAWLPFWLESGTTFTEKVTSEVEPDTDSFKIMSL